METWLTMPPGVPCPYNTVAVLVISHDDRYFHLADRLLRLESGKLLAAELAEAGEPATPSPATL